jgi:hypothetical protein
LIIEIFFISLNSDNMKFTTRSLQFKLPCVPHDLVAIAADE